MPACPWTQLIPFKRGTLNTSRAEEHALMDHMLDELSQASKAKQGTPVKFKGLRFSISLGLTTKAMQCLLQKLGLNRCFQMCLATLVALSVLLNFTVLESKMLYSMVKTVSKCCNDTGF